MSSPFARLFPVFPALLVLAAIGCGAPDSGDSTGGEFTSAPSTDEYVPTEEEKTTPVIGDHFIKNPGAEPGHLNPFVGSDGYTTMVAMFVFDTMIDIDNETLKFVPRAAKDWKISDDQLTYTYYLRDDIKFHDGEPLTAADVKFTFEAILNPENDTLNSRNYYQDIETIETPDDYTVVFTMKKPYFRNLFNLGAVEILPEHIYSVGNFNKHPNNRKPIGSGPYMFDRWDTGQQIVIKRNPDYWGDEHYIEKRVFRIVTDDEASFQLLQRQELDEMRVPPEKWVKQADTPEFKAKYYRKMPDSPQEGYLARYGYIGWNMRKPQLAEKEVRQALTMLFDRELIIETIYHDLGKIISGPFAPSQPEYNSDIEPWPFDPQRAVELLESAGWIDSDRDGIREKNGVKLEFELSFTSQVPEYEQLGTVYQEELKRAGINMRLNPLEWATFLERVYDRSFDACMLAWIIPFLQDPYQIWHSSQSEGGSNHPGFKNAEVDALLDQIRLEFDREKRVPLYHRIHEIIHEEQPYTFMMARPGLIAVAKRFQNVNVYALGLDSTEWWVPTRFQMYTD